MQTAFSNEYFNLGKNAYDNGLYGQAKEYLSMAVKSKPKNKNYRYYYALALSQLGMVEEAAEQYQMITLSAPNSIEGQNAARALETLNRYYENKAGEYKLPDEDDGNYMSYIITENSVVRRWDKDIISVYIPPQSQSKSIVEKAFESWSEKSDGFVNFNFVPTPDLADINVSIVDKLPIINTEGGVIRGSNSVKYQDKNIVHADIIIQDSDYRTKEYFTPDTIYAIALHEIGHAIGLNTHSESPKDIMFFQLSSENRSISKADVNTLKMLYKLTASSVADIKTYDANYSIKLNKAKDYVEAYPQLPTAWSGLAAAYVSVGDYEQAIAALEKAIELKPDEAILYTQQASYYEKLNNPEKAIEKYKTAYDLQPDNKVYLYNWAKACNKYKRQEEARPEVDSYLMGQGFLANDEISRLLRRMYKQDKEKEKEKIKSDREKRQKKQEEMEEMEQDMFAE